MVTGACPTLLPQCSALGTTTPSGAAISLSSGTCKRSFLLLYYCLANIFDRELFSTEAEEDVDKGSAFAQLLVNEADPEEEDEEEAVAEEAASPQGEDADSENTVW